MSKLGGDLAGLYERLRKQALGGGKPRSEGLGLALIRRCGLAAWMRAWSDTAGPAFTGGGAAPLSAERAEDEEMICQADSSHLVIVLAGMAMRSR